MDSALLKLDGFTAKKRPIYRGVCDFRFLEIRAAVLPTIPAEEVWGIGGASAADPGKAGSEDGGGPGGGGPGRAGAGHDARLLTVTGGRTVLELRSISCMPLELVEPVRKGIAVTRSFGAPVLT